MKTPFYMKSTLTILTSFALLSISHAASAQSAAHDIPSSADSIPQKNVRFSDNSLIVKDKLSITPVGRLLMDGALFVTRIPDIHDGVGLAEARIGLVAEYNMFKARVEFGYSYNNFTPRDIYLEADFSPSTYLRAGYILHQYGLNSAYTSSNKPTMEQPVSNAVFETPRLLGALFVVNKKEWFMGASVLFEPKALTKSTDQLGGGTAWGVDARFVYRPVTTNGNVVQIGWSGGYKSPEYNDNPAFNHKAFNLLADYPTKVARVQALGATIDDARSMFKFTPELLLCSGRVALESQYYFVQVNRRYSPRYNAYGTYAIIRGLLFGEQSYGYAYDGAMLSNPANKSLELTLCYNYTCLSDKSSAIYGGRLNEISATLSWYINKYFVWRLRYGYTHVWNRTGLDGHTDLSAFQTRFQFVF